MGAPLAARDGENPAIGRGFVAGDAHGELPTLERLLVQAELAPERDRPLALGNLVYCAPRSTDVFAWMEAGRIALGVRGNRGRMLPVRVDGMGPLELEAPPWARTRLRPRELEAPDCDGLCHADRGND